MKRLILASSVLTVCLTTLSPIAIAGEVDGVSTENPSVPEITPFNLVHLAYSGGLSDEGIPGFNLLSVNYVDGTVEAEDLVKAGINQGRLSEDTLDDEGYLNAVEIQLDSLRTQPGDDSNDNN